MAREKKPFVTATGNVLTPDYLERLVAEAEAGYAIEEMLVMTEKGRFPVSAIVTGPGRPSLSRQPDAAVAVASGRPGHSHRIDLRVDDDTSEAVRDLAVERNVAVSEIVREAIARYLSSA